MGFFEQLLLRELCAAVLSLSRRRLVHGDLKADNVLVCEQAPVVPDANQSLVPRPPLRIFVIDFGAAYRFDSPNSSSVCIFVHLYLLQLVHVCGHIIIRGLRAIPVNFMSSRRRRPSICRRRWWRSMLRVRASAAARGLMRCFEWAPCHIPSICGRSVQFF